MNEILLTNLKNLCLALCEAFGTVFIVSIIFYLISMCIDKKSLYYDLQLLKIEKWMVIIALTVFIISLVTYKMIPSTQQLNTLK